MSIPSRPSWAIVLSACAAALLGTALAATPARAADPAAPVVTITTPSTDFSLTVPPPGDVVLPWSTTVRGDADAEDVVIAADLSGISGFVDMPSGCPKDVCSLELGNLTSSVDFSSEVPLVTGSGATVGSTGTVVFSGTSSNGTVVGTTVKVTVTAGPAKLLTVQNKDIAGVKPGSSVHIPFSLANVGGVATPGATVQFNSTAGLTFPTGFSNCVSSPSTGAGEYDKTDEVNQLVCTFDTVLQPGRQYRLSSPLDLGVTDHALYEQVNQQAAPLTGGTPAHADVGGSGPELTLVDDGPTSATTGYAELQRITVDNTADMAALGDTATGKPGDKVTLTATLRNDGPAIVDVNFSDDQPGVMVDIPKGTTAVQVPDACSPFVIDGPGQPALGKPVYICVIPRPFQDGQVAHFAFVLKIGAKAAATTTGKLASTTVYGSSESYDRTRANNTALFTVHVTGGSTGTTGGGSGGSSGGTGGSGGSAGGSGATGSTGGTVTPVGSLADTGTDGNIPLITTAGGGAVALGGGLLAAAVLRRRRLARS